MQDNIEKVKELVDCVLEKMFSDSFKASYENVSENELKIDITGEDVSALIGQRGHTLLSFQHLIRQMYMNESEDYEENLKIIIDVDGYKIKRIEKLKDFVQQSVEKAKALDTEITLPKMTAYERYIIHSFIQENFDDISTYSTGEEPNRKVTIKPSK